MKQISATIRTVTDQNFFNRLISKNSLKFKINFD